MSIEEFKTSETAKEFLFKIIGPPLEKTGEIISGLLDGCLGIKVKTGNKWIS